MYSTHYRNIQRIRAKRDYWINLFVVLILAIFVVSIIIVPDKERWIIICSVFPVTLFLAWIVFGTYYIFDDKALICQSGPFREKIFYDTIRSLKLCENFLSSMALSRERIEIKQHGKNYITGTTYISPVDRESFYFELKQRCRNLDGSIH